MTAGDSSLSQPVLSNLRYFDSVLARENKSRIVINDSQPQLVLPGTAFLHCQRAAATDHCHRDGESPHSYCPSSLFACSACPETPGCISFYLTCIAVFWSLGVWLTIMRVIFTCVRTSVEMVEGWEFALLLQLYICSHEQIHYGVQNRDSSMRSL